MISGLSLATANYATAREQLQSRHRWKEHLILAHIQELLMTPFSQPGKQKDNATHLWMLQDKLLSHKCGLEGLGTSGEQYRVILTPLVISQLPAELRMEWAHKGEGHKGDLDFLMEFLHMEIRHRECSRTFIKEGLSWQCKGCTGVCHFPDNAAWVKQLCHLSQEP